MEGVPEQRTGPVTPAIDVTTLPKYYLIGVRAGTRTVPGKSIFSSSPKGRQDRSVLRFPLGWTAPVSTMTKDGHHDRWAVGMID